MQNDLIFPNINLVNVQQRILIQQGTKIPNLYGSYDILWQDYKKIWAKIYNNNYFYNGKYKSNKRYNEKTYYRIFVRLLSIKSLLESNALIGIVYLGKFLIVQEIHHDKEQSILKAEEQ